MGIRLLSIHFAQEAIFPMFIKPQLIFLELNFNEDFQVDLKNCSFIPYVIHPRAKQIIEGIYYINMGLGKRDLERKRKSIENKIAELEAKAKKNPLDKNLQAEIKELKKKLEK